MILKIDPINPEMPKIRTAAKAVLEGKLVAIPTETVYGLAANAFDDNACRKIFSVKGRPADNPLIVTVGSFDMAKKIASIPTEYLDTLKRIWPSPITFVMEAKEKFPKSVTSGLDTIAVRMPAHPVPLALINECNVPLAAPSANISKHPSATNASHVIRDFGDMIDVIIDSGDSFFGVESTIIDLRDFSLLRPGAFSIEEIERFFGKSPKITNPSRGLSEAEFAITPGMKYKHYAPNTPIALSEGKIPQIIKELDDETIKTLKDKCALIASEQLCRSLGSNFSKVISLGDEDNLYDIARNLFSSLRKLDEIKADYGLIESFTESGIGLAIMNRLRKATSHVSFSDKESLKSFLRN